MINVIVCDDYNQLSNVAFEIMLSVIKNKADATLGLATGSSPIGLYQNMIADYDNKKTSYKMIKTFNLDEYVGIDVHHPESYHSFMHRNLFDHIDIDEKNIHIPSNMGDDLQKNCDDYNKLLAENVIDIQLLGIGSNGHIGFNEPGTSFEQETFIVKLTDKTRQDNKRFFNSIDEVPTHAITMGIKNIMQAKRILMLISGVNKADTVVKLLSGNITTDFPASVLNNHPDVTVIIDQDAYSKM